MKDTFYFPHDTNASQDPKIIQLITECGLEGLGMYWIIIEILHQQEDGCITPEQFKNYVDFYIRDNTRSTHVQHVLNTTQLVFNEENKVFSKRVIFNKKQRENLIEKKSLAGKKSAEARANPTHVQHVFNTRSTRVEQGKERKGNNKKEKIIKKENSDFEKFWTAYPVKRGRAAAEKIFEKITEPVETLVSALTAQKQERAQRAAADPNAFIPEWKYPTTWLNQQCWTDEPAEIPPPAGTPAQSPGKGFRRIGQRYFSPDEWKRLTAEGKIWHDQQGEYHFNP